MYRSQGGQDKWVETVTGSKRNGTFIEVGAYDGLVSSNTYYLEYSLGWTGICVEAGPSEFAQLAANRPNTKNVNMAVMPYTGFCEFENMVVGSGEMVPCDTLTNILRSVDAPALIDYMSLDIEGCEVGALESVDWDLYKFGLITVEHNLYAQGPHQKDEIFKILSSVGYERLVDNAPCLDTTPGWYMQPYEDWYVLKGYLPNT